MDFINKIKLQKNVRFKYTYTSMYNTIDIRLLSPTSNLRKRILQIKLNCKKRMTLQIRIYQYVQYHRYKITIAYIQLTQMDVGDKWMQMDVSKKRLTIQEHIYQYIQYRRYKLQPNNPEYTIKHNTVDINCNLVTSHMISYHTIPYHIEMQNTSYHIISYHRYKLQPNNPEYTIKHNTVDINCSHIIVYQTIPQHIISYLIIK
eukprot:TRINITY_DN6152_c0_g1_i2.p2 TRINITY_DN6152_c0_g1~~TRINITY_DN6152_c0_g1_i2.p2  ORF type:complete len:203 (+),score=-20.56 TRINITY_DN6152_c0_g1_i2:135-743(+)